MPGASWESGDDGLWLSGVQAAGTAGEVRSKERSALPWLALRLLCSFSWASAANCSKYLYLEVKFQRASVKRKRSPWPPPAYGRNTCRVSWFPDAQSTVQGWLEGPAARIRPSQDAND